MTVIIIIAAVLLIGYMIYKKISHGGSCCGEHEKAAEKTQPADRDITHYPYRYIAGIEGMVCSRCVRNVENALNSEDGIYARAELGAKTVTIYSKHALERRETAMLLDSAGYTLTDLKEEKK